MKKTTTFFSKISALFVALIVCGAMTAQTTNYGIEIAGTELTSDNAGAINNTNFPNLGLTEGTITYDPSAKTFTLTGVTANVTSDDYFMWITNSAEEADYTINLVGNNVITSYLASIVLYRNLFVTGDGSLKVTSTFYDCGFCVKESTLTIRNTTVEAIGWWGIAGDDGSLIIEKSNVTATGEGGSICDFKSITLTSCKIRQPKGATIANPPGKTCLAIMSEGRAAKYVKITPFVTYPLWVVGVQANEDNLSAITGTGIEGRVSYDPSTTTLTLNNAKIKDAEIMVDYDYIYIVGIRTTLENLNIHLIGENLIDIYVQYDPTEDYQGDGIRANKNLKLYGDGTLHIKRVTSLTQGQTVCTGLRAGGIEIDQATVIVESVMNSISINDKQKNLKVSNGATVDCRTRMVLPKQPIVYSGAVLKEGDTTEGLAVVPQLTLTPSYNFFQTKRYVKIEPIIIHYDGENDSGIGASSGATFTVAIRLTNDELRNYYKSHQITQVRYYINGTEATSITIKIYGHGTATAPGELLVNEPASPPQKGWNSHTLSTPLLITSGDYWVGYEVKSTGGYPAGVDAGPTVPGKGGWIYMEGEWGDFGSALNCNLNIRAVLTPISGTGCPLIISPSAQVYPNPVNNNLNIECAEKIDNLELYDAFGRMVMRKNNVSENTSIDVSNFNSGIYILKLRTAKGSGEYKVVKN